MVGRLQIGRDLEDPSYQRERERERGGGIRMIYSFRPLPLMKGCRWMTYHFIVHNNNVHLSCAHQRPERSHDTY